MTFPYFCSAVMTSGRTLQSKMNCMKIVRGANLKVLMMDLAGRLVAVMVSQYSKIRALLSSKAGQQTRWCSRLIRMELAEDRVFLAEV